MIQIIETTRAQRVHISKSERKFLFNMKALTITQELELSLVLELLGMINTGIIQLNNQTLDVDEPSFKEWADSYRNYYNNDY